MYRPNIYRRDDESSEMSRTTIIIIATCSGVGGLLLILLLYRVIRRCRNSQSVPLPPVQPLAHHREHQVALYESSQRPQTWYEPAPSSRRPFSINPSVGSKVSLLGESNSTFSPNPTSSISHDLGSEIEVGSRTSQQNLPLPTPSYANRPSSSSSLNSSNETGWQSTQGEEPFPSSTPPSVPLTPRINELRTSSLPSRRPRPLSMSSAHSYNSRTSRHTVRGTPHGPLSQVQIVLPEPLAPFETAGDLVGRPRSQIDSGAYDRRSIADPWISVGTNDSNQLPSTSLGSINETTRPSWRRSQSLPRRGQDLAVPPVPQLPTNWDNQSLGSLQSDSRSVSTQPRTSQISREDSDTTRNKSRRLEKQQT